jgi:hypothetical protein
MFLHQRYDKETRTPYSDLVDGQQRTEAISDFWEGRLVLSSTLPTVRLRRRKIKDLDESDYESLVTYSLPVFDFTDATDADVREAFRRINSHTSVLNAEEKRHANYQGALKWFVSSLAQDLQGYLLSWGVLTEAKIIRMADTRLIAELLLTAKRGLMTIKDEPLDRFYQDFDEEPGLGDQDLVRDSLLRAFQEVDSWAWIWNTALVKSYQVVPLLLAVMHAQRPVEGLAREAPGGCGLRPSAEIELRLGELARALESSGSFDESDISPVDDEARVDAEEALVRSLGAVDPRLSKHVRFVRASEAKTNTEENRRVRFLAFFQAVARPNV